MLPGHPRATTTLRVYLQRASQSVRPKSRIRRPWNPVTRLLSRRPVGLLWFGHQTRGAIRVSASANIWRRWCSGWPWVGRSDDLMSGPLK